MSNKNQKTILLVEDELIVAMDEKLNLQKCGYNVLQANTGEKAICIFRTNNSIDLILMDIDLGKSPDGIETAITILKERPIPIVFLSSHTEPEIVEKTEKITSYGYVSKNSSITVLDASIKMAFKLFDAHKKLDNELSERLQSEAALKTSEAKFKHLTESISDMFTAVDKGLRFTYWNRASEEITGVSSEEAIGKTRIELFGDNEDTRIAEANCRECMKTGRPVQYTSKFVLKGQKHFFETQIFPTVDGATEINRDITEKKIIEEKLLKSEERFRTFVESIPDGFAICSAVRDETGKIVDFRYEYINKAGTTLKLNKGSVEEHLTKTMLQFTPSLSKSKIFAEYIRISEAGGTLKRDSLSYKDAYGIGNQPNKFFDIIATKLGDGFAVIWRDISDRKQAEAKINLQNIILNLINCIHVKASQCETMEDLGKACLNLIESATESQFSFISEIGQDSLLHDIAISDPGWDLCKMFDKEGHRRMPGNFNIHGLYGQVLLDGKSLMTNDPGSHPKSIGVPEGHPKITAFLGVPFIQEGRTAGMIAVGNREGGYRSEDQEILKALAPTIFQKILRKRTDLALKENQAILKTIIESTPDFISLKDPEGRYLVINPAAADYLRITTGCLPEDIIGKKDDGLYPPEIADSIREADRKVIETGEVVVLDQSFVMGNEPRFFSTIKSQCHDASGNIIGIVSLSRDVTIKKDDDEKIKTLLREKELLLKEVHHRIKNNMSVINSLFSMHSETLKDPVAISALQDAEGLVRSMMVLYDKLYQSVGYNNISVKDYLISIINEIIGIFPNRNSISIEKEIDEFILDARRLQLMGIIINELITNIMKYAYADKMAGLIIISVKLSGNHVSVFIQDNGIGMPESIDFENSAGFGLRVVKIIADQLNGDVRIERENGTKVILEFEI